MVKCAMMWRDVGVVLCVVVWWWCVPRRCSPSQRRLPPSWPQQVGSGCLPQGGRRTWEHQHTPHPGVIYGRYIRLTHTTPRSQWCLIPPLCLAAAHLLLALLALLLALLCGLAAAAATSLPSLACCCLLCCDVCRCFCSCCPARCLSCAAVCCCCCACAPKGLKCITAMNQSSVTTI